MVTLEVVGTVGAVVAAGAAVALFGVLRSGPRVPGSELGTIFSGDDADEKLEAFMSDLRTMVAVLVAGATTACVAFAAS